MQEKVKPTCASAIETEDIAIGGEMERGKLLESVRLDNFSPREIMLLRAYGNYARQLIEDLDKSALEDCLVGYHEIFTLFLRYFYTKFDPDIRERSDAQILVEHAIEASFKTVENSYNERILRLAYDILQSTVRTNYFLQTPAIALKFDLTLMHQTGGGIQPRYETFVTAHGLKGTHMRISKVCRGGIRYSNRTEDFRNEVKALMITQEAKNAVIVPKGAKGGFILDAKGETVTPEAFKAYYSTFINALLDVVDDQKEGKIVRDSRIVAYDGDDAYFVVAADRGTSGMSDTANAIALERGFWLGDAFASGGSNGFHHKKLGITAKGALRSSQRFFLEMGVDFYKESISVIGVGSMSGDVFGNGMIESDKFLLIGAISSDEVFIDPTPDAELSFLERKRLFLATRGKWSDYDATKISKGGGVFKRSDKNILLSAQIKTRLNISEDVLSGEELANRLLKAEADMLYFGGIGTYVKSSVESHEEIGDKENAQIRVDATELRVKVVCEGANLAISNLARIEFARVGGKLNLDSIDNSAGVDTSDHEVNLKILLHAEATKANLIAASTKEVQEAVLRTNYLQSLSISLDVLRLSEKIQTLETCIGVLEKEMKLFKRGYFDIPKAYDIDEIIDQEKQIVRPVIATLTLYTKILIQDLINDSSMSEDPFFERYLFDYFPKTLTNLYHEAIKAHPLKKEIISMMVSNKIINAQGVSFIEDLEVLGKEKFLHKIKAYLVSDLLFDGDGKREEIFRQDYHAKTWAQYQSLLALEAYLIKDAIFCE